MQVTVDEKRIFNPTYSKSENTTVINQAGPIENIDKAEITQSAAFLNSLPINLVDSKITEQSGQLSFDFTFNERKFQNISASGYYSSKEKNLSLNLRFIMEKELYEGGEKGTKRFQVDISINASHIEIKSLNKKIEKEDIYNFLNRVMKELTKMLNDDKVNVTGMIFDKDDLADLLNLGDKETSKMITQIFLIIQTLANIKRYKNPDAENVIYTPKRFSQKVMESQQINKSLIDVKMSINELNIPK